MTELQIRFPYRNQNVEATVQVSGGDTRVDTVIFLGTAQIKKIPQWVCEACPSGVAVVQGLPHWYAGDDGSDLSNFAEVFTREALRALKHLMTGGSVHIIADSQAVPGVLLALAHSDTEIELGEIVLLQPLGFNAEVFGDWTMQRLSVFKSRLRRNMMFLMKDFLYDARLRYAYRVTRSVMRLQNHVSIAQYTSGLGFAAVPALRDLVLRGERVQILSGANDALFPAREIRAAIQRGGVPVQITEVAGVAHAPLVSRQGKKLLQVALDVIEAPKNK